MEKEEIVDFYQDNQYVRSNFLIGSKYKSSLLENRLMAICFTKISEAEEDAAGGLSLSIKANDIKNILGVSSHKFFSELNIVAERMTGRTVGWSDPETETFEYTAVVTKAKYNNGIFKIDFNKDLNSYLKNLESNYTILQLDTMLKFKSNYSFRLFEVLKSRAFYPKNYQGEKDDRFRIDIDLYELRFMIGLVEVKDDGPVQRILNETKKRPDYERAYEAAKEKKFETWYELRRNCIDVAIEEINSIPETNMHVTYEAQKAGKGGKVHSITFFVELNNKVIDSIDIDIAEIEQERPDVFKGLDADEQMALKFKLSSEIQQMIGINDFKSTNALGDVANWDIDLIKSKWDMANKSNISDPVGWLIKAIKEDYMPNPKSMIKKKNSFKNFEERKYDFEQLELKTVNK